MKKYKVFIHGENFLIKFEGEIVPTGFYVTRLVEAKDEEEAELKAIEMVRKDKSIKNVKNSKDDPPMLYVEELAEVESFGDLKPPGTGFIFY